MSQQINLYQPIFRKERIVFSAQTIAWLSLGLVILLVLWSVLIGQRVNGLEAELERQQQAEQRAIGQVAELQSSMPPTEPDGALQAQIERLQARRDGLRESLTALQRRMPAAEVDLLARLDALSAEIPDGLWLTGLLMADQGQTLTVDGNALEARLVPAWLTQLSAVEQFSGLGFRQIRLRERSDGQPGVQFTISTAAEETP
ncbi:PilN domain-containing protein [Wenzhouxiangella sp. EGI_FJ10305]|uniref:PilN domain-containing protein n=1 Tax=Wenzhouxiangella sp. EGI_FJ10305 TaxID=3243768 RepID=UPI0035DC1E6B